MTFDSEWRYESQGYDHGPSARNARPQRRLGGAALACVALACAWTLYVNLAGSGAGQIDVAGTRGDKLDVAGSRGDKLVAAKRALSAAANAALLSSTGVSLFDPRYTLGRSPGTFANRTFAETTFANNAPLQWQDQFAPGAPSPSAIRQAQEIPSTPPAGHGVTASAAAPAPPLRSPQIRNALLRDRTDADRVLANAPTAPTIFADVFGKPSGKPAGPALAYAAPDDGVGGRSGIAGRYDGQTAVYDISARTVYMPDGTRLEAHSGYGSLLDDPRHADAKDRGVTPPNVYDLELREAPFHGVRALRLIPVDDAKVFGRSGLLAHSFMLGPNGDSNGCVSFRDYDAFLQAYMNHEIKRLVVVAGQG